MPHQAPGVNRPDGDEAAGSTREGRDAADNIFHPSSSPKSSNVLVEADGPSQLLNAVYPGISPLHPTPGNQRDLNYLFSILYEELRRLAAFASRNEGKLDLSPATLVHEVWFKLKDSPRLASISNRHFKLIVAKAMRQVLVDEARRRRALKRGGNGEVTWITLGECSEKSSVREAELLDLDSALEELRTANARQAEIVERLFFGGQTIGEISGILEISESTAERDWRVARAWLKNRIRPRPV